MVFIVLFYTEIPPPEPLEPIEEVITSDLVDGEASEPEEPEEPEGIPPYFTQKPTSQKVEEGQDVKFVCKLVAAPSPEVTWYHGNKTVKVTGRFSVEIEADVHHYVVTFTIRQTNPKDAGSYIITLSNSVGEAKAMVSLTVERPKKEEAPDFRAKLKTKKVEEKPPEPEIPQEVPAAFVKVPKNLTVYAGNSGKFECKYIGEPQPNLAWFRNDAALPQDERFRVEITDSGMCTLHIDAITMADAGWYKCVVSNQHGEQSCCAKLMVEDKPEVVEEPPAVEEEQKDIPTIQEEPVTVEKDTSMVEELRQAAFEVHGETVDARDESKAELRVEEKAAPTETLTELTVGEGLDLKRAKSPLVEFPLDKERTFSGASVESPAPEDFLSAEEGPEEDETVPSAPSFLQTIEDFIVVPGEPALFQCRVAGNPTPEVAWFRDGAKIEPSDRYVIVRSDAGVTSLTIRDVTEKDEAEYTCTAVNSAGSAFCTADIYFSEESRGEKLKTKLEQKRITKQEMIVEFPPESPTEPGKDETAAEPEFAPPKFVGEIIDEIVRVEVGGTARFTRRAVGRPKPQLIWYKDDVEIEPGGRFTIEYSNDGSSSLVIPNVRPEDEEEYICRAVSEAGQAMCYADLIVDRAEEEAPQIIPPSFSREYGEIRAMEGGSVRFVAAVTGSPEIEVAWLKDGVELHEGPKHWILFDDNVAVLAIPRVDLADEGFYTCRARNAAGMVEISAPLIIEVPELKFEAPPPKVVKPKIKKPVAKKEEKVEEKPVLVKPKVKKPKPKKEVPMVGEEAVKKAKPKTKGPGPFFIMKPKYRTVPEGSGTQFRAKVGGDPKPTVRWMKGKWRSIEDSARIHVYHDTKKDEYVMEIRETKPSDAGNYKCIIENEGGKEVCGVTLIVEEKPKELLDWRSLLKPVSLRKEEEHDIDIWEILKNVDPSEYEKYARMFKIYDFRGLLHHLIWQRAQLEEGRKKLEAAKKGREAWQPRTPTPQPMEGAEVDFERAFEEMQKSLYAEERVMPLRGPEDQRIPPHNRARFECEIEIRDPKIELEWYLKGEKCVEGEKFQFERKNNTYTLIVNDGRIEDSGKVGVVAGPYKGSAFLTVDPMLKAGFLSGIGDIEVPQGEPGTFCCEVTPDDADVTWYKEGVQLEQDEKFQFVKHGNKRMLVVRDCQPSDEAIYAVTCGDEKSEGGLTVEVEVMEITKHIENIEVIERHNATFECELNTEYADVTWFRDEKQLEPGEKYSTSQKGCSYYLTIYDVTADDEGEYTAVVADKSCRAELFVILEGALQLVRPLEDVHCLEWQPNVYFECEISAAGQQPRWFRLEEEIFEGDKYRFEVDGKVQRLHFHDVVCADQDEYSFKIERISTTAKLYVEAREIHFDSPISDLERLAGEPAHFEFELDQTDVETRWFKEETQITMSPKYKMIDEQTKHKLEILDCQPDDAALYKVKAGPHTSEAHLWVKTFQEKVAMKGGDATLDVLFPHEADDDVRWFMLHPVDEETISAIDEIGVEAIPGATLAKEMPRDVESPVDVAAAPPLPDDAILTPEGAIIIPDKGLRMSPIAESDKYTFLKEGRRQSLIIHDADDDDKQAYTAKSQGVEVVTDLKLTERTQLLVGPENQEVPFHTKCVFECEINNETEDVLWLKYEQELPKIPKYSYEKDGFKRRLIIKDCVEDDEDDYQVVAGEDKAEAWLLVIGSPEVFLRPLQDQEILESEEAVFECEISLAKREVTWYREDQQIFPGDKYEMITEHKVRRLKVKDGRLADEGEYSCIFGDQKTTANLYVKELPADLEAVPTAEFSGPLRDQEVWQLEQATFECEVAKEEAYVMWLKNGEEVMQSEKYDISVEGRRRILKIKGCLPEDETSYMAKSGDWETTANLIVKVPVTFILGLEDQYAIEGDEEASFMCAISDPEAEVTWYRESEALSEGEKYSFVAEGARRKLLIRDIKTADQTKYSCATNADKTEANLFVEALHDFCPGLEDQYAIEYDDQAQFSCRMSHPDAEVTWYKNDQKLENSEKYEILLDGHNHYLVIRDIRMDDDTSYSCESKHRKTTALLVVEELIDISPGLEDQYAIEYDAQATFSCRMSKPNAKATWYMGDKTLENSEKYEIIVDGHDHSLIIKDIRMADDTVYSCESKHRKTSALLFVEALHDFCPGLEDQYAIEYDDQAQFACKLTQPNAETTWYREDEKLENSVKYEILVDDYDHSLIVKDIRLEDQTSYSCQSKHRKTTANMFVEALVDFCPGIEDQYAIEKDAQAQFSCKMTQPDAKATWFREEEKIQDSEKYEIIADGYDHGLIIKDIQLKDETSYTCASKHRETTAKLFVEGLVDLSQGLTDQYAVEGDASAVFACEMSAADSKATWYREEDVLEPSDKYEIRADGNIHRLVIKDIKTVDETNYSCASKHRKTTANLYVEALLDFCPGLEDQYAIEYDAQAKFSCKMTLPNAEATWYRDDERIDNSDKYEILVDGQVHTLIIKDIRLDDDTSYSCASKHRKTTAKLFVEGTRERKTAALSVHACE
ncbi:PREDICTED: obscurin-like [Branchiostoma belcheri]|uniref:Obscurin-like n=1 Tax=Branchiostoma belcheri TaxID=7741 RepID=A0A6P4Z6P8_BRABE|nr:PREDICTED: obscurin-like [Branchiostoma belcheri]